MRKRESQGEGRSDVVAKSGVSKGGLITGERENVRLDKTKGNVREKQTRGIRSTQSLWSIVHRWTDPSLESK